jgi:hypothetical protein
MEKASPIYSSGNFCTEKASPIKKGTYIGIRKASFAGFLLLDHRITG